MDRMEELEKDLSKIKVGRPAGREIVARGLVEIGLNILTRFSLNTSADLCMVPNQWDVARYHGDKRWELIPSFNFKKLGEVMLIDRNPKGAGILASFQLRRGENMLSVGFLLPRRTGERNERDYFMAYEEKTERADIEEIWNRIRPGVYKWFESLLRDDLTPLITTCESLYRKEKCPELPTIV